MKFFITKTFFILFLLCFTQLTRAEMPRIKVSQIYLDLNSCQPENAQNSHANIDPFWPIDNHSVEEHLIGEEVSEEDMLSDKKTFLLVTRVQSKRKLSNNLAQKPSNESMGILSPPPKA